MFRSSVRPPPVFPTPAPTPPSAAALPRLRIPAHGALPGMSIYPYLSIIIYLSIYLQGPPSYRPPPPVSIHPGAGRELEEENINETVLSAATLSGSPMPPYPGYPETMQVGISTISIYISIYLYTRVRCGRPPPSLPRTTPRPTPTPTSTPAPPPPSWTTERSSSSPSSTRRTVPAAGNVELSMNLHEVSPCPDAGEIPY